MTSKRVTNLAIVRHHEITISPQATTPLLLLIKLILTYAGTKAGTATYSSIECRSYEPIQLPIYTQTYNGIHPVCPRPLLVQPGIARKANEFYILHTI